MSEKPTINANGEFVRSSEAPGPIIDESGQFLRTSPAPPREVGMDNDSKKHEKHKADKTTKTESSGKSGMLQRLLGLD